MQNRDFLGEMHFGIPLDNLWNICSSGQGTESHCIRQSKDVSWRGDSLNQWLHTAEW